MFVAVNTQLASLTHNLKPDQTSYSSNTILETLIHALLEPHARYIESR